MAASIGNHQCAGPLNAISHSFNVSRYFNFPPNPKRSESLLMGFDYSSEDENNINDLKDLIQKANSKVEASIFDPAVTESPTVGSNTTLPWSTSSKHSSNLEPPLTRLMLPGKTGSGT